MTHLALLLPLAAAALAAPTARATGKEPRLYELRIYHAAEGKLDALNARFRDHTAKLFEKHGITNVGYWVPIDNKQNLFVYVLSYPDMAARKKSWDEFSADPDWKKARAESEKDGRLVTRVDQHFLTPTDYSPEVKPSDVKGDRVFELRTYTVTPGRLDALNARFRDHTMKLFERHGMTNLWYWTPAKGQKDEGATLVYMLAHKSVEARNKSFDEFRKDPEWVAVKDESEKKAGGSLTTKVESVLMKPTDYSPIK